MARPSSSSPSLDVKLPQIIAPSFLRQSFELVQTILLLGFRLILPDLANALSNIGMGVKFNPATDIGPLDGKVILVTGGTFTHFEPFPQSLQLTRSTQATPA